jgi:hypothetical protein
LFRTVNEQAPRGKQGGGDETCATAFVFLGFL